MRMPRFYIFVWQTSVPPGSKFHWVPGPPHDKGRSALLPVADTELE